MAEDDEEITVPMRDNVVRRPAYAWELRKLCCLNIGDAFFSCFIHFPALVCFWRGIWDLIGYYILKDDEPLNYVVHTIIGAYSVVPYFLLPFVRRSLPDKEQRPWLYFIFTRIYMYSYAFPFMCLWRGVWTLADFYLGEDWKESIVTFFVCYLVLVFLRSSRNTMWPPFVVSIDSGDALMVAQTRFGVSPKRPVLYVLDSLFTQWFVMPLSILVWRSVWNVGDYILPHSREQPMNNVISLSVGLSIAFVMLLLQYTLSKPVEKAQVQGRWLYRLFLEDVYFFIAYIVLILTWRGGWNLNSTYIFGGAFIGGWVNHAIGVVAMLGFHTFSLVGCCGQGRDGFDDALEAIFPNKYLRKYFDYIQPTYDQEHLEKLEQIKASLKENENNESQPL